MMKLFLRSVLILITIFNTSNIIYCQSTIPEILENGTLEEQLNYLEERTRIYEDYRAIREDMFQLVKKNSIDSLSSGKSRINSLIARNNNLSSEIDSLNNTLSLTRNDLDEAVRTKNTIRLLGMNLNKFAYNTIMWIITGVLCFLLVSGFLAFRRNISVTTETKKELEDLKNEFEEYRTKSRIEREKMSLDHFNEIKRLKGKK
jgi:hypothetical protein